MSVAIPIDDAELELWVSIPNRIIPTPQTAEEVRAYREAVEHDRYLLAFAGEEPPGAAQVSLEPQRARRSTALGFVCVLPEGRGRGLGSALHADMAAWAVARGLLALEGYVMESDRESLAWASRRGYVEAGRDSWLALDLTRAEVPPVDPPEGIEITTWSARPEVARGLYEVACEAYPDVPGQDEDDLEPFEDWLVHDMGGPNDRPEAVFVALAGSEVVGYSKFHLPEAWPLVAIRNLTGVKRAWRRRGLGGALKRAQIAWAKEAGYERLETWNELRNESRFGG